jgi:hypothetical protein
MALHYRRIIGAWLVAAGIFLNLIPMAAHGGLMPIAIETIQESGYFPQITEADVNRPVYRSKDIILYREDIRFHFLADRFAFELPLYGGNIYSLGDLVLFSGVGLAAVQLVVFGVPPPPSARGRRAVEPAEERAPANG